MLKLKPLKKVSMFVLNGTAYYCIGMPIEATAWYKKPNEIGVWTGKTNISSAITPLQYSFPTLEAAFEYLKECAKDPSYQYGLIKDFSGEGTLYYEKRLAFMYFKNRCGELDRLSKRLKRRWKKKSRIRNKILIIA